MNSWVFITIVIMFNILVGALISLDAGEDQFYSTIEGKASKTSELVTANQLALEDTSHTFEDYAVTKTAGNELDSSFSFMSAIESAFGAWFYEPPNNRIEKLFNWVCRTLNAIIGLYAGFLLFMIWKNKKNT